MSRIGKRPVVIPQGAKASMKERTFYCEGPKGKMSRDVHEGIDIQIGQTSIEVSRASASKDHAGRALHGLERALIANMLTGVTSGFEKQLEVSGVGFRGQVQGRKLNLQLGYSHPCVYEIPEGLTIEMPSATEIHIKGVDKQLVGQAAANIRSFYPPEPYKGKGVMYKGEHIRRKSGKSVS